MRSKYSSSVELLALWKLPTVNTTNNAARPFPPGPRFPRDLAPCRATFARTAALVALACLATVHRMLIELLLGHNIDVYECLKVSSQPMWAPLIMNGFRAIGVVLTLNMLIAQMVATYEKTRERLGISFKFQSSILMLSWFQKHSAVPAALRILSLPYFLLLALYQLPAIAMRLFSRCLRRMANDWSASRWLYDQFHPESPTPESPPIAATAATLREAATKHLKKCLGERTAEDDRWRARIAKELVELKEQGKMTNVTLKEQGEAMATKKELVDIKKEIVDEIGLC